MNGIIKSESQIYKDFDLSTCHNLETHRCFAYYIICLIMTGEIEPGYLFPPREYVCGHSKLSYKQLREAYAMIESRGFLERRPGKRHMAKLSSSGKQVEVPINETIYANYHVKKSVLHTVEMEKAYHKSLADNSREIAPALENNVSELLISFWVKRINAVFAQHYQNDNFFYVHGYQVLLRAVIAAVCQCGGAIIIPALFDVSLKNALDSLMIDFVEVSMDREGLNLKEVELALTYKKVAGIVMMSNGSVPQLIKTSPKRVKQIIALRKTQQFMIIDIDFYAPCLVKKINLVLKYADKYINDVIYITPLNNLLNDMAIVMGVAASPAMIIKIKEIIKMEGIPAMFSVGNAIYETLVSTKFPKVENHVANDLAAHKIDLIEVFDNGFWDMRYIKNDTGFAFALVPKRKFFPLKAYEFLLDERIHCYDPALYGGSALDGLLFDLSQYIGKKNLKPILYRIEETCRNMCL